VRLEALRSEATSVSALLNRGRLAAWSAAAPAILLLGHVLPKSDFGLALRLAGAAAR
jgi:hypothetical protein